MLIYLLLLLNHLSFVAAADTACDRKTKNHFDSCKFLRNPKINLVMNEVHLYKKSEE